MRHSRRGRGVFWLWAVALAGRLSPAAPPPPALPPFQPLVDAAVEGGELLPPPGRYAGPVVISRPLTIDGRDAVTIDGRGAGTVVVVKARGVTLRRLHLTGTGASHDALDTAVSVEADGARVERNVIDDALFGVHVKGANDALVCGNRISSKAEEPALRGDGVRVWNGARNRVVGNDVFATRDVTLANASDNLLAGNRIRAGRYGTQLVFAPRNRVEGNLLDGNLTGIAVLYSDGVVVVGNRVQNSHGQAGAGLTFKESSQAVVEDNAVVHCAVGAKTNAPTHPLNVVYFRRNLFAHNVAGMDFYGENGGHVVHGNRFERNLTQVTVSAPMSARGNDWLGNAWDDFEGFDRDGDGVGDVPHEVYTFADRIWMEEPRARFFRNSPALELLDFLERLAPFASPELLLRDPRPLLRREAAGPRTAPRELAAFSPWCPEELP